MKISDAVNLRRSRRTYVAQAIKTSYVKKLNDAIEKCNAISGLNIQLVLEDEVPFKKSLLKNARNYIALVGKGDDITREKCGYYGEKLVLFATGMNLGTCWMGGFFDKKLCNVNLKEGEMVHLLIAIGTVKHKLSLREKILSHIFWFNRKNRKKATRVFGDVPHWFWGGVDAALKSPSAFNRLPVLFRCTDGDVSAAVTGKFDYEYYDLGIAKLHFEIGALGGEWEWGNSGMFTNN